MRAPLPLADPYAAANGGISPLGYDGLIIRFADSFTPQANRAALALRATIEAGRSTGRWPGVVETAPALVSCYLRYDPAQTSPKALTARLRDLLASRDWTHADWPAGWRRITLPTAFHPDLAPHIDTAAEAAGFASRDAAVESLCAQGLRVLTLGFAPGQPYLGQLPPAWDLPRQRDLTPHVPVGALGLAVRQMVLFSTATRTGWQHVGQTALRPFRPTAPQPVLLQPGDLLQFTPASPAEITRLSDAPTGGARIEAPDE